jgi:hypothetical protein
LATPCSKEVRLAPDGPYLIDCTYSKIKKERRVRIDEDQNAELHEFRDVAICVCMQYRGKKKSSLAKRALFGAGAAAGVACIGFATGGLGLVAAAVALKITLGAGAFSGVSLAAGSAIPANERFENYKKGSLMREFEMSEPVMDWRIQKIIPLKRGDMKGA